MLDVQNKGAGGPCDDRFDCGRVVHSLFQTPTLESCAWPKKTEEMRYVVQSIESMFAIALFFFLVVLSGILHDIVGVL